MNFLRVASPKGKMHHYKLLFIESNRYLGDFLLSGLIDLYREKNHSTSCKYAKNTIFTDKLNVTFTVFKLHVVAEHNILLPYRFERTY